MGMFNWVKFEMACPKCGAKVDGFQTKDGDLTMAEVDALSVCEFYSACPKCDSWIEFHRKKSLPPEGPTPSRSLEEVLKEFFIETRARY